MRLPGWVLDTPPPRFPGMPGGPGVLTLALGRPGAGPKGFLLSHLAASSVHKALAASRCEGAASLWRFGSCLGETPPCFKGGREPHKQLSGFMTRRCSCWVPGQMKKPGKG